MVDHPRVRDLLARANTQTIALVERRLLGVDATLLPSW